MRNLESLTASKILSVSTPELIFSRSTRDAKLEYRSLIRRWHPDFAKSKDAPKVVSHLVKLYDLARKKLALGNWEEPCEKIDQIVPGRKKLLLKNGTVKTFNYLAQRDVDMGVMYIADSEVLFELDDQFEDLVKRGRRRIRSLTFADEEMASEMSRYLPDILETFESRDKLYVSIRKTPDQLLLKDVLDHFCGQIQPVSHAGWILNNLYNFCCYLEWAKLTHNSISIDTVFVSPLRHSMMVLGGWWFSLKQGEKFKALPDTTLSVIPPDVLSNKYADRRVDLELVKLVGRTLLGDADGEALRFDSCLPRDLVDWLLLPAASNAFSEYATFKYEILEESFGPPKFVELKLDSSDLYQEIDKEV